MSEIDTVKAGTTKNSVCGTSISVCMATFNGEAYVSRQVISILGQLQPTDELIVVDDCSTDGTLEIIRKINDPRISIHVNDRNRREVFSFSRAMSLGKNDLLFLSDQDDVWLPGRVALMQECLLSSGTNVVTSNFDWIDENDKPINVRYDGVKSHSSKMYFKNIVDIFLGKTNYFGCAMALRREFAQMVLPIPSFVESHDLWIALASNLAGSNVHLDERTFLKRKHNNNTTNTVSTRNLSQKLKSRLVFLRSIFNLLVIFRGSSSGNSR
jgi:glycosyltransferase involved in cell wall biosynthesis